MHTSLETVACPDCGLVPVATGEDWLDGLCPSCLFQLGLEAAAAAAEGRSPHDHVPIGEASTLPGSRMSSAEESTPPHSSCTADAPGSTSSPTTFSPGQLLGERYRIESLLGHGGMGEVWRAYDLKLRLEVALKRLHPRLFDHRRALELLRDEVRAAREVVSPNVCRLFDLVDIDGRELVSMEYIDGVTLLEHLHRCGPLELKEANEIASQLLAGLEAIHHAGLVHRDIKPENVMLTRTRRVVVMDFGLTSPSGTGSMAGTPAYMSPEQGRGEPVDARADVFSAGMVLAEMLSAAAGPERSSRQTFWRAVRQQPPQLPESPWQAILQRALSAAAADRYASAVALSRALEEVAFRVEGAEHERPYPGLASFQEADAELFFGREAEVESLWKKLAQAQLLGLIGPSGSGKSSFVNAGVLPARPEGWSSVRMAPGRAPFAALGRALLPALQGGRQAMEALVALEDPAAALTAFHCWRAEHDQVLLIVDQFEELFTQSSRDVQSRFAELLGRAAFDADVHVLLSMRDDFLFHCQAHEALRSLFSELTPLGPPTGSALRRALVQPALRCGYRFEDEAVVEAMLEEVTRERGALPLIAFTAAQLWDRRDTDTGYLTAAAYSEIGGVGGALAQHAEATLAAIGAEREAVVRELFRNLVTAQGTRASRDREELLSVFGPPEQRQRQAAEEVLDVLIDARLLTSYETPADDESAEHHRIEIIHESLLTAWPRLVRWQDQDRTGAQLRDELRNQAHLWQQHGRLPDYLWTGTAFRELELWRERYPGGLSAIEEAYVAATIAYAERRRRRRRLAVTVAFAILLSGLAVVGGFWRRSVLEGRRAEAANLFSQARLVLEKHPTGALAYAIAALERSDSSETRRLVVDALWRGPPELRLSTRAHNGMSFSPDGKWLATTSGGAEDFYLWPSDGGPKRKPQVDDAVEQSLVGDRRNIVMSPQISPRGDVITAQMGEGEQAMVLWSFPEGRWLRTLNLGEGYTWWFRFSPDGERLILYTERLEHGRGALFVRSWPVAGGEPELIARIEIDADQKAASSGIDPSGSWLAWSDLRKVRIAPFDGAALDRAAEVSVEHEHSTLYQWFDEQGRQVATGDVGGNVKIWSLERGQPKLIRSSDSGADIRNTGVFSASGSLFAWGTLLWDLTAPVDAEPLHLRNDGSSSFWWPGFPRGDRWFATGFRQGVSLWPLTRSYPALLPGKLGRFTPNGRGLITLEEGQMLLRSLDLEAPERRRPLFEWEEGLGNGPSRLAIAPDGSFVATASLRGHVRIHSLGGGPPREFAEFVDVISALAVGPQGRFVAAGSGPYIPEDALVRVWDLETGQVRVIDAGDGKRIHFLQFRANGDLLVHSGGLLRQWDLSDEEARVTSEVALWTRELAPGKVVGLTADEGQILVLSAGRLWLYERGSDSLNELSRYGSQGSVAFFDPIREIVVTGDAGGAIRVGRLGGGDPHLLLGHSGGIASLDVSADGQRIVSSDGEKTLLWTMPDLSQPPIHTWPRDQLLAKLRSLTNLRAVPDPESSSGWKIEVGPFPGWQEAPTW